MDFEKASRAISVQLEDLENKRLSNKALVKKLWLIFLPLMALVLLLGYIFQFWIGVIVLSILFLLVPIITSLIIKNSLRTDFKTEVLKPFVKEWNPDIEYAQEAFISRALFVESNLFSSPDRYSGEDLFHGRHGKTKLMFSEVHAEEKHVTRDSKGNTRTTYITLFKGIFMIADFNKHLKTDTYVYSRGGKGWFSSYERVKLENPVFEKEYNTYSKDQVEARYILTPNMMEKILNIKDKFSADLYLSFKDNHVFIGVSSHNNYFDPDLKKSLSLDQMKEITEEIQLCLSIVDDLDLNTRIWTKQ